MLGKLIFSFLLALIPLLGTQVSKQIIRASEGMACTSLSADPDAKSVPFLASCTNPSLKDAVMYGRGQGGALAL